VNEDNVLHYMQAIWLHESPDQRWIRLKDVRVPDLYATAGRVTLRLDPVPGAVGNVAHLKSRSYAVGARCGTKPADDALPTMPLIEVADLDELLGLKANYKIFALKKPNVMTSFMMTPSVERAVGGFGITDPGDLGNMTLDEFGDCVCCLRNDRRPTRTPRTASSTTSTARWRARWSTRRKPRRGKRPSSPRQGRRTNGTAAPTAGRPAMTPNTTS
jgi:hypothetical protein